LFVANGLYAQMLAKDGEAERILRRFEAAVRHNDARIIEAVDGGLVTVDGSDVSQQLLTLMSCHRETVAEEFRMSEESIVGKWGLDLSLACLISLLREFGDDMVPLRVLCDESKPLLQKASALDVMVDRTEQEQVRFAGRVRNVLFNLNEAIEFADSKSNPGIQLADVFASVAVYATNHPDSKLAEEFARVADKVISDYSIMPDLSHVDLESNTLAKCNAVTLHGLVEQSVLGTYRPSDWPLILADLQRIDYT